MKKKIILDCDPGHDDAVAIMLAAAHDDIEILGNNLCCRKCYFRKY